MSEDILTNPKQEESKIEKFKIIIANTPYAKYNDELIIHKIHDTIKNKQYISSTCMKCDKLIAENYCEHCYNFHMETVHTHCNKHCILSCSHTDSQSPKIADSVFKLKKFCSDCLVELSLGTHGTICKNHPKGNKCRYDCEYCCLNPLCKHIGTNYYHSTRHHRCEFCKCLGHSYVLCKENKGNLIARYSEKKKHKIFDPLE
jgi:hypothetical protein